MPVSMDSISSASGGIFVIVSLCMERAVDDQMRVVRGERLVLLGALRVPRRGNTGSGRPTPDRPPTRRTRRSARWWRNPCCRYDRLRVRPSSVIDETHRQLGVREERRLDPARHGRARQRRLVRGKRLRCRELQRQRKFGRKFLRGFHVCRHALSAPACRRRRVAIVRRRLPRYARPADGEPRPRW